MCVRGVRRQGAKLRQAKYLANMISLNGAKFAEPGENLEADHTGFVRPLRANQVEVQDRNRQRIAVINARNVLCCATRIDGRYWYSYADVPGVGAWPSYSTQCTEIESARTKVLEKARPTRNVS